MPTDLTPSISRILPARVFNQIGEAMQEIVRSLTEEGWILTEEMPLSDPILPPAWKRFFVVVSQPFSGLLLASSVEESMPLQATSGELYQIELTFNPLAIAAFLKDLNQTLPSDSATAAQIERAIPHLQLNDSTAQSDFTLRLVEILSVRAATDKSSLADSGACDVVVAAALQQQVEQEQLLNQVTTHIRQSMELPIVLQTAVQQVQQLFQADRVVIYQFQRATPPISASLVQAFRPNKPTSPSSSGQITYESRANPTIPSILDFVEKDNCFIHVPNYQARYHKGHILSVDDIETTYGHSACLLELLRRTTVRAKLVAPIMVQDELWGLLIVHQCLEPRKWQDKEKDFLQKIAEHLAIAIYQARLYAQVQQQAQTLEQRVIERTQELHSALKVAQSANLAKAEFLATMSHELRTPLTCIIGMATTLQRLGTGPEPARILTTERQQNYLKMIQNSGEHLLHLINDILDLSVVEAGRLLLENCKFSLSQLASESVRMLKSRADDRGITLTLEVRLQPKSEGTTLAKETEFVADPRRIKQVLLNLLSNAIKFTLAGGEVTLRVWREDNFAVFQVEDTGIGIPDSQRSLLFNKFQQLDMSRERSYEGTGLGLALTKQLVELHQGWIEVESTVDVGSIFTVWLPEQSLDTTESRPAVSTSETPTELLGRVLLIENHEETATLICDLLTTAGYQVVWMIEGSAVMQQVKLLQPLVVLLSARLVGMDAHEILHQLGQDPETQKIPVLVLASVVQAESDHWTTEQTNDWVVVPMVYPEQLLSKVSKLITEQCQSS